jgi:hypothetical protein
MNIYELTIEEFQMHRHPQTIEEVFQVEAPTAADAITIGQVRHSFPVESNNGRGDVNWRRLVGIKAIEHRAGDWLRSHIVHDHLRKASEIEQLNAPQLQALHRELHEE